MENDYKTIYSSKTYFSGRSIILDNIITACKNIKSELHSILKKRGVENYKSIPVVFDYEVNDHGSLLFIRGYVEVPFTLEEEEENKKTRRIREKHIQYLEYVKFLTLQKKFENIKSKEEFFKAFDAELI